MEKEDGNRGERERIQRRMHTREWEGEREREMPGCATRRGRENETMHFLFHRTVETHACHGGGVGGCVVAVACAREGGRRKTRMRLMIYAPATVYYYRLELRPRLPSFRLPLFFLSPPGRSPALSASHFLRLSSLADTPTTSTYFT